MVKRASGVLILISEASVLLHLRLEVVGGSDICVVLYVMLCTQGNCQSTRYLHSRDLLSWWACIKVSTLNHKHRAEGNTYKLLTQNCNFIRF